MAFQLKVLKHLRALGNFHMKKKQSFDHNFIILVLFPFYFII